MSKLKVPAIYWHFPSMGDRIPGVETTCSSTVSLHHQVQAFRRAVLTALFDAPHRRMRNIKHESLMRFDMILSVPGSPRTGRRRIGILSTVCGLELSRHLTASDDVLYLWLDAV